MNKTPRQHQIKALEMLKQSLKSGKRRPVIQAPTGFGKSLLAAMIIEGALNKGNRVIFVVPAIALVDQTVDMFKAEGIDSIGVMQASHELTNMDARVQVASVQTLARRQIPRAQVCIIDECHLGFRSLEDWMMLPDWHDIPFIGLSATPWARGMGKYWDDLIIAETVSGLIDKGFLSPFRAFAPAHPDVSKVKTLAGDYHEGQLAEVMEKDVLVAGIVETWLAKGEDRPTLLFAVNCAHAKKLQQRFERAGIACGYVDAYTTREEREYLKDQFHSGGLRIVCSVGTMIVGVDWDVRCIIMARPTKSIMLYVQAIGRGLRTAEGKQDLLILDHSDNSLRLGLVTDIQPRELSICNKKEGSGGDKEEKKEKLPKECTACTYLKPAGVHKCPNCGFEPLKKSIEEKQGELVELTPKRKLKVKMEDKQAFFSGLVSMAIHKGYSLGWASNAYREYYGVWPNQLEKVPGEILPVVENFIRSKMRKYVREMKEKQNAANA